MKPLRSGIIGILLLASTNVLAANADIHVGSTNMGPDDGFEYYVQHDKAGELADRLKVDTNVVGVMSGREDAVAIIFTREPSAAEITMICEHAENVGFSVMHKIIRLKQNHPLEDMCP